LYSFSGTARFLSSWSRHGLATTWRSEHPTRASSIAPMRRSDQTLDHPAQPAATESCSQAAGQLRAPGSTIGFCAGVTVAARRAEPLGSCSTLEVPPPSSVPSRGSPKGDGGLLNLGFEVKTPEGLSTPGARLPRVSSTYADAPPGGTR
jgi:hypothetical protein